MSDNVIVRLRKAIRDNRSTKVCHVGTHDRVLLESQLDKTVKLPVELRPQPGPEGAFLNFDGVWLLEDPSLPVGEISFPQENGDVQGPPPAGL